MPSASIASIGSSAARNRASAAPTGLDPELATQEAAELVARREPPRLALEHLDRRLASAGAEQLHELRQGRQRHPRLAMDRGQHTSAIDDGWRSMSTATHSRGAAASIASMNGPIASMS